MSKQRLIDANTILKDNEFPKNGGNVYELFGAIIKAIIDAAPTVEERETGEWLDNETSYSDTMRQTCTCSVCGKRSLRPLGDFCRWCGADMRTHK